MANVFGFASLGTAIAALVCTATCYFLPYWVTSDLGVVKTNTGLLTTCTEFNGVETCDDPLDSLTGSDKAKLRAVRAMVVIGGMCTLASITSVALLLFKTKNKVLGFAAGGLLIGAGVFLMIWMAIFADTLKTSDTDYGAGFVLCIVGTDRINSLFLMIGMAIFADTFKTDDLDYGAGFALCIVGWLLAWIAGALASYSAVTMLEEGAPGGTVGPVY